LFEDDQTFPLSSKHSIRSKWTPPGGGKRCSTYLSPSAQKKQKTDENKVWEMFKLIPSEEKKMALTFVHVFVHFYTF
jgi:hypothetical protein